jgi:exonuclease SbcD
MDAARNPMRILHTSDWHLGRSFGPVSLDADQRAFLDWLVDLCVAEHIDLVAIAGDLYDRAIPPVESVALFRDTLRRLLERGVRVAAITGNHDSPDRVAAYGDLLDLSGVWLRGGYARFGEVLTVAAADGPLDLVLLPFLDPQAAPDDVIDATVAGDDDLVQRRVRRTHQSVLEAAVAAARPCLRAPRSLVLAHAFVAGGSVSDSERQLTVGGTGQVEAAVFDGFSYVALGHLHRPQAVAGRATIRYSGTPLAYSFSEDQPKTVVLVDLAPDGTATVREIPVPVGRPVATIEGTMADLLGSTPTPERVQSFIRAIVTDRETVLDAKARLAEIYPFVVEVRLQPVGAMPAGGTSGAEIRELTPLEATRRFWAEAEGDAPDEATDAVLVDLVAAATGVPA